MFCIEDKYGYIEFDNTDKLKNTIYLFIIKTNHLIPKTQPISIQVLGIGFIGISSFPFYEDQLRTHNQPRDKYQLEQFYQ